MTGLPADIPPDRPVLIAGPTASGKSALALRIAEAQHRSVVNADALQVFAPWRILTARPDDADLARAPHHLYGHVGAQQDYSVGHWLRELEPLLAQRPAPVIVGGTGLYFTALTEGLATIPPTPPEIRAEADRRIAAEGAAGLLAEIDADSRARIDTRNPVRVQRAWEVQQSTGRGLAAWHADPAPPLLPLAETVALRLDAPPEWLTPRIAGRFDVMLERGALDEVRASLGWLDRTRPAGRAIGADELARHLRGEMPLDAARHLAIVSTRRYAKRQRTWFRARMRGWTGLSAATPG